MATTFPLWLDPKKEVKIDDPNAVTMRTFFKGLSRDEAKAKFILLCVSSLLEIDQLLDVFKALEITSNSCVETGYGQIRWVEYNFGGWKINERDVNRYIQRTGEKPKWWQAPGHVKSGDAPICYYRTFSSPREFFGEWLNVFVPKNAGDKHRYKETGKLFWRGDSNWFIELCKAEYKGSVVAKNYMPSFIKHKNVLAEITEILGQKLLKVDPDGKWGKKSEEACRDFQKKHGLLMTGTLNSQTLNKLIEVWKASGYPL